MGARGEEGKGATDAPFAASLDFRNRSLPIPSFQFQGRSPSGRAGQGRARGEGDFPREGILLGVGICIWRNPDFFFACLSPTTRLVVLLMLLTQHVGSIGSSATAWTTDS